MSEFIYILKLLQSRKEKIVIKSIKDFIQFIFHIDYVTSSRKKNYHSMYNYSILIIVTDWFSPIIVPNVFCSRFLRIMVHGSVVCIIFFITLFTFDRYDSCSKNKTSGAKLSPSSPKHLKGQKVVF